MEGLATYRFDERQVSFQKGFIEPSFDIQSQQLHISNSKFKTGVFSMVLAAASSFVMISPDIQQVPVIQLAGKEYNKASEINSNANRYVSLGSNEEASSIMKKKTDVKFSELDMFIESNIFAIPKEDAIIDVAIDFSDDFVPSYDFSNPTIVKESSIKTMYTDKYDL
ncbi:MULTISPECIES: hypothetical protein [Bacillus]|uniref:hypothetical protein n=1 Tax=Bacillus TaxID=1386 RepID=UPI000BF6C016|nr:MULTISPECIES: hypothetical protein [Bacillus]PFA84500.1 hypothetical protein CN393_27520 [Bacillus cereus]